MITSTPGTDTPGIYDFDITTLEWAAKLTATGDDASTVAELLGPEFSTSVPAQHHYAALTGKATHNAYELLRIIDRLAAQARKDAGEIARLKSEHYAAMAAK